MKKIISIILLVVLVLSAMSFAGCVATGDAEAAILWSGNGKAENPNSLINSMERAMYIKSVAYKHYGADNDIAKQVNTAKEVLDGGCKIIAVELVNAEGADAYAQEIVAKAKEKGAAVIFFNCSVGEAVIADYEKCYVVNADTSTLADVQGEFIAEYVKANFAKMDKNADNKISCIVREASATANAAVAKANALLATEEYSVKAADKSVINTTVELADVELLKAELVVTEDDTVAFDVLLELQKADYNTDKLITHFVPVVTVGETVDYKAFVVDGRPEIPSDLIINADDDSKTVKNKNKQIKRLKELMAYYEANKYLVDLTAVNESDLNEMIYTTVNVVEAGRLAGTVMEDRDSISIAVASIVRNLVKGDDAVSGVASKVKDGEIPSVVVEGAFVKVRYIAYGA
ncbi:MAG: hypothetical protein E7315_03675 [Clostridiales bacterium]|nr:hypothetical protein [Clostridiales bacterium]